MAIYIVFGSDSSKSTIFGIYFCLNHNVSIFYGCQHEWTSGPPYWRHPIWPPSGLEVNCSWKAQRAIIMSNTTCMGFYGSWNLIMTLFIWSEVNVTSKMQLKCHLVVKLRVLMVLIKITVPNFIDVCIQVTQIWSYLDYLMQYCMPAVTKR